jgi:hypothetical protein
MPKGGYGPLAKTIKVGYMRRTVCILLCFLCIGHASGYGASARTPVERWRPIGMRDLSIGMEVVLTYDDNIFRYSSEDIDTFVNNRDSHRFPIESYDDLITTLTVRGKLRKYIIEDKMTTFNVKYSQHQYGVNSEKDYQILSCNIWQRVSDTFTVQAGYILLPRYFIRYYPDYDLPRDEDGHLRYEGCYFKEHLFRIKGMTTQWESVRFEATFGREIDDYNDNFNEYDTRANRFGIGAIIPLRKGLEFTLTYGFKNAWAQGYDGPGEDKETSDDPDISYDQDSFGVSGSLDCGRLLLVPTTWEAAYEYRRKYFTTDKSIAEDPYHSGRVDEDHRAWVGLHVTVNPVLSAALTYCHRLRDVSSSQKAHIEEIKNYRSNRFSLGMTLNY